MLMFSFFIEHICSVIYSFRLVRIAHPLASFSRKSTIPKDRQKRTAWQKSHSSYYNFTNNNTAKSL